MPARQERFALAKVGQNTSSATLFEKRSGQISISWKPHRTKEHCANGRSGARGHLRHRNGETIWPDFFGEEEAAEDHCFLSVTALNLKRMIRASLWSQTASFFSFSPILYWIISFLPIVYQQEENLWDSKQETRKNCLPSDRGKTTKRPLIWITFY